MQTNRTRRSALAACVQAALWCALAATTSLSHAQSAWPNKQVRIVVPFAPAGTTDILARAIAPELSKAFGQTFYVDNKPGAGGNLGADIVAKSPADGYTLLMGHSNSNAIAPFVLSNVPYNPAVDFTPITYLGYVPNVLVVKSSLPVNSVAQLISLAKANPGQMTYGSSGIGSTQHLAGALFGKIAGIQLNHVPYKGSGPATTDLLAGEMHLMFHILPLSVPFVRSNKLRAIAATTAERSPLLPDVPTMLQSGLKDFEVTTWYGILGPAGLPRDVVTRLNTALGAAVKSPANAKRLSDNGLDPSHGTPEALAQTVASELARWAVVVKAAGIVVQ